MENMPAAGFSIGDEKILSDATNDDGTFKPGEITKRGALIAYGRAAASTKPSVLNDMVLVLYDEYHFLHSCITMQHINSCPRWNIGPEDAHAKLSSMGGPFARVAARIVGVLNKAGLGFVANGISEIKRAIEDNMVGVDDEVLEEVKDDVDGLMYKQLGHWLQACGRARTRGKTPTGSAAVLSPAIEREARNMGMVLTTVRAAQWIAGKHFPGGAAGGGGGGGSGKGAAATVAAAKSAASPAAGRSAAATGGGGTQAAAGRGGGGTTSFKDALAAARAVAQADHPTTKCPFMDTPKGCINPKCDFKH